MSMSITELERALKSLRLSGMSETLQARALAVSSHEMDFIEAFSWLVQDELDRRHSRLLDRRYALCGLSETKDLKSFDWGYNPKLPRRSVMELATLKFIDAREDALLIGPPGTGKSYTAKALALLAVQRGYKVLYREAHQLLEDLNGAHPGSARAGASEPDGRRSACGDRGPAQRHPGTGFTHRWQCGPAGRALRRLFPT